MTTMQKVIKYVAMAFALLLVVSIIGGILNAVGLLGGIFDGESVAETLTTHTITSQIQSLDIRINAADLTLKEGDAFRVESNLMHLKVEEKNGVLTLHETRKVSIGTAKNGVLTVYVPAGTVFERVNLSTGAGRVSMGSLSAHILNFELGAGEVTIGTLTATKSADIEGGAGRVTISGGAIRELELEMGVGQLNLSSALTGECQLELGVGESNITLLGAKEDYTLELEKGVGSITVDGTAATGADIGNGPNEVEISGGVGAVNVNFSAINPA